MQDIYLIFITVAHENPSGCAASIVRLVYSIQSVHTEDFTYLAGLLNLWAVAETTCGILAMCLPISPKFFRSLQDAQLWSVLRGFSFSRSKLGSTGNSETPSDESKAAKLGSGPHDFKAYFKRYNYKSTKETELDSISSQANIARSTRDDHDPELA